MTTALALLIAASIAQLSMVAGDRCKISTWHQQRVYREIR